MTHRSGYPHSMARARIDTERKPSRAVLLPNANNPRLLLRVMRLIASGVRRPRSIGEILEIERRTVHYYTQASEWLGFLEPDQQSVLTESGLTWVFSEEEDRTRLYARAVWGNAFASHLMSTFGGLPPPDAITKFILAWDSSVSESTARRRASAIRGLLEPALPHYPTPHQPARPQLVIPFAQQRPPQANRTDTIDLSAGIAESPDLYREILCALLDAGELRSGCIRSLLDNLGAQDAPLSRYIEMALRRGDATRSGEHLVVAPGAIQRRVLASDVLFIALSDPHYREALSSRPESRIRKRFALWDLRLFDGPATPEALQRALVGRRLESIPIAGPQAGPGAPAQRGDFLSAVQNSSPVVSFPATLTQLSGRVQLINALLLEARKSPSGVRLPSIIDERQRVHGGLLAPGERLMAGIPDNLTLRIRVITCCPAFSLLAALLLLDRRQRLRLRITRQQQGTNVHLAEQPLGGMLSLLSDFCEAMGWPLTRPPKEQGLTDTALMAVADDLGMLMQVGDRVVLTESLFVQLQEDPEFRDSYERLLPLERIFGEWLETKSPKVNAVFT